MEKAALPPGPSRLPGVVLVCASEAVHAAPLQTTSKAPLHQCEGKLPVFDRRNSFNISI
jgi:hypothetical protein